MTVINLLIIFISLPGCQKEISTPAAPVPLFDTIPSSKPLVPMIEEVSGIADSKKYPGHLWVNEDSGNKPALFLVGHTGVVIRNVFIKDADNRDWEEMFLHEGFIYVGDIGDNSEVYGNYSIYRFPEPGSGDTVFTHEVINFTYPDGSHDAEAFFLDPGSKSIYILTKRGAKSGIYKLDYPYAPNQVVTKVGELSYSGVTGAAIANDGRSILIRTYLGIFYYEHKPGKSIQQTLAGTAVTLKHQLEPQGESITYAIDGSGFFTLSEKGFGSAVNLHFYPKK